MPLDHVFMGVCLRTTDDAGWASVYYPPGGDYVPCLNALDKINTLEMAILNAGVECPRIFVSDIKVPGDVATQVVTTTLGGDVDASGPADPAIALACFVQAGQKQRATKFLRGLTTASLIGKDPASWHCAMPVQQAILAWANGLKQGFSLYQRPGKRNQGNDVLTPIDTAFAKPGASGNFKASIRKAGRPFGLRRGRRMTG